MCQWSTLQYDLRRADHTMMWRLQSSKRSVVNNTSNFIWWMLMMYLVYSNVNHMNICLFPCIVNYSETRCDDSAGLHQRDPCTESWVTQRMMLCQMTSLVTQGVIFHEFWVFVCWILKCTCCFSFQMLWLVSPSNALHNVILKFFCHVPAGLAFLMQRQELLWTTSSWSLCLGMTTNGVTGTYHNLSWCHRTFRSDWIYLCYVTALGYL